MKYFLLVIIIISVTGTSKAQNYSAIHGSNYSGGLGVYNNPSSILNTPYKWDVTVIGLQYQAITNALIGPNFPLNISPMTTYYGADGNFERYADVNFNTRLLNARISLDNKRAFAFGLNVRGYVQANTSQLNYTDSVAGPRSFLSLNLDNGPIDLDATTSAWFELYGSYGWNVWDRETSKLNAGATVKILRGMAGGFAKVNNVGVESAQDNDQTIYKINQGAGRYGYSDNLGNFENFTAGNILSGSKTGIAFDLGAEYIIKTQAVTDIYDEGSAYDYEWKIGVSLLDLGWNGHRYSTESRSVSRLKDDVSSFVLNEKFSSTEGLSGFNDSLATIVDNSAALTGNFKIYNPARAVINADRYISGNVFVNAELSLNLASGKNNVAVTEARLLTVTPRWESRKLGFFAPVQYTRHGNFWIGGAVKIGPLLLGTHNLLNAFAKNKKMAGGAYLAITIRPVNFIRDLRTRQYDCPEY